MGEFIENPFREMWEGFSIEELKKQVNDMLDKIYVSKNQEDMADLLGELDDLVMSFVVVLKLKDVEAIEVVRADSLPQDVLDDLGFEEEDLIDGYIPKSLIPPEFADRIEESNKKKAKRNNWLIDK